MDIDNLAKDSGAAIFYDDSFRAVLEDHMTYLRTHPQSRIIQVEPHVADRWAGDLYGLLISLNIAPYLHWVIMRMNGMLSPQDCDGQLRALQIPYNKVLETIKNVHKTKSKVI